MLKKMRILGQKENYLVIVLNIQHIPHVHLPVHRGPCRGKEGRGAGKQEAGGQGRAHAGLAVSTCASRYSSIEASRPERTHLEVRRTR